MGGALLSSRISACGLVGPMVVSFFSTTKDTKISVRVSCAFLSDMNPAHCDRRELHTGFSLLVFLSSFFSSCGDDFVLVLFCLCVFDTNGG